MFGDEVANILDIQMQSNLQNWSLFMGHWRNIALSSSFTSLSQTTNNFFVSENF